MSKKNLAKFFVAATNSGATPAAEEELATLKKTLHSSPFFSSSTPSKHTPKKSFPAISKQVLLRLKKASSLKSSDETHAPVQDSAAEISREICSILKANTGTVGTASAEPNDGMLVKNILGIPWFSNVSQTSTAQRKKEISRERKAKYIFNNKESLRFTKLMQMCADKLGTESTLEVFGRLGRETGIKEYNALIKLCIAKARKSNDEDSLVQIHKAFQLFVSMKERGFQIQEGSYGPFFTYMIDMRMVEEFQIFSDVIKEENPGSYARIGYYEMLLWIRVGDEGKIEELCRVATGEDNYQLAESYLLAFCDSDRKEELLQLLEVLDIRRISSVTYMASIFKSLGRLQLENFTKKFILALKTTGAGEDNSSTFIYDYVTSIPNLAVHAAIDLIEHMCQSAMNVPVESIHPLLHACEQNFEFDMVRPIYSVMRRHNLKLKGDTFKSMISLYVRMKNFEGAYNLLMDAKEMNEMLTASMYNAIMAGYFREKNIPGALLVLKQMEDADVKPDSETYSYLITNCEREEDVVKYREQMRVAGVQITKHIYMALINAYAKFGNFEMAKEVVVDREVPPKYLNDIKSALVSALSSNGQMSDALNVYDEIKQAGCSLDSKAVISLIEHLQSEGELDRLLQILEELNGSSSWFDGCSRVALYCVRYNLPSSAIELLKKLKEEDEPSVYIVLDQIFSEIWKTEPTNLELGFELLEAVEGELRLHPSRTSLDFLLSTCVKAKDAQRACQVWSEYKDAGLSYNVLTYLRMYQALLASGEYKAASKMLKKIPRDDAHVSLIIDSCKVVYCGKK